MSLIWYFWVMLTQRCISINVLGDSIPEYAHLKNHTQCRPVRPPNTCRLCFRGEGCGGRYCHSEYSSDFDDASSTLSSPQEWEDQEDARSCRKPKQLHHRIPSCRRGSSREDRWKVEAASVGDRRSQNPTSATYDFRHLNCMIVITVQADYTETNQ